MPPILQLYPAQSGSLTAQVTLDNGAIRHLHSIVDPQAESALYAGFELWGKTVVFLGMGLGYHATPLVQKLPETCTCIVIDFYDQCLDFCKESLFKKVRRPIRYISGATREQVVNGIPDALQGPIQIIKHPASYYCHQEWYDAQARLLRRRITPLSIPSTSPENRRVLLCSGTFFLEEELARALRAEDATPLLFRYREMRNGQEYESSLARLMQEHRPAFILSVNMKGFDGNGALMSLAQSHSIPVVVWFVDDPHPIVVNYGAHLAGSPPFAFTWERAYIPYLRSCGFTSVAYLPLAGDPSRFLVEHLPAPEVALGFVGSSMGGIFLTSLRGKFLWQPSLESLAAQAAQTLLRTPARPVYQIVKDTCKRLSRKLPFADTRNITWFCCYVIHMASMLKRKTIMLGLLEDGCELFGDPQGWAEVLGNRITAHPDLDYQHELARVYGRIAVNINITSCQMASAVNQRVFDIPLAGSLALNDHQSDLDELFALGKEMIVYETLTDLREKIVFYRKHQTERETIIRAGRNRILHEHTYRHRVRTMLSLIKSLGINM